MIADPYSIAITLFAYSCNCFMFYVYYTYEELANSHPTPIIQGIIFFQANLQLANSILFKMCDIHLPEIFAATVFFDTSREAVVRAQGLLFNFTLAYGTDFSSFMAGCLTMMLCIDLLLILKYPLASKTRRMKFYYGSSIILSVVYAIMCMNITNVNILNLYVAVMNLFLWGFGIASIIFAIRRLCCKEGVNREIRKLVVLRHVVLIIYYLVESAFYEASLSPTINGNTTFNYPPWFWIIYNFSLAEGFFQMMFRMIEPLVFRVVVTHVKNFFCCRKETDEDIVKKQKDQETGALLVFLCSSLNVELVYIILTGIIKFGDSTFDRETLFFKNRSMAASSAVKANIDGENLVITMESVEIQNYHEWEQATPDEFFVKSRIESTSRTSSVLPTYEEIKDLAN